MSIGERIKKLRKEKKLTLEDLASKVNTTAQTIYKYENNIITNIPSDKIELLAANLDSTPAYLMGWSVEIENKKKEFSPFNLETLKKVIKSEPKLSYEALAIICKQKRIKLDWTEKKVSSLANININEYLEFENNDYELDIYKVNNILNVLDISIEFILGFISAMLAMQNNKINIINF